MSGKRWLISVVLAMFVIGGTGTARAAWPGQFADVESWPAWALKGGRQQPNGEYIAWGGELAEAVWWELMIGAPPANGDTAGLHTFRPQDMITRGEYAVILARALGVEGAAASGGDWYRPAVNALRALNIIGAGDDFSESILRREMGDWVGRGLQWYGVDLTGAAEPSFSDTAGIIEEPYIKLAAKAGVITGYPDGTYRPERTASRAEAAAMAVRVAKQLKKHVPEVKDLEQRIRKQWVARATAAPKKEFQAKPLEPYMSPMLLNGPGGYAFKTKKEIELRKPETPQELLSLRVEPIMLRDNIALVKLHQSYGYRALSPEKQIRWQDSSVLYAYYIKLGGNWVYTNGKLGFEFPDGWQPKAEGS